MSILSKINIEVLFIVSILGIVNRNDYDKRKHMCVHWEQVKAQAHTHAHSYTHTHLHTYTYTYTRAVTHTHSYTHTASCRTAAISLFLQ